MREGTGRDRQADRQAGIRKDDEKAGGIVVRICEVESISGEGR